MYQGMIELATFANIYFPLHITSSTNIAARLSTANKNNNVSLLKEISMQTASLHKCLGRHHHSGGTALRTSKTESNEVNLVQSIHP
jgi:hypothetical protein